MKTSGIPVAKIWRHKPQMLSTSKWDAITRKHCDILGPKGCSVFVLCIYLASLSRSKFGIRSSNINTRGGELSHCVIVLIGLYWLLRQRRVGVHRGAIVMSSNAKFAHLQLSYTVNTLPAGSYRWHKYMCSLKSLWLLITIICNLIVCIKNLVWATAYSQEVLCKLG